MPTEESAKTKGTKGESFLLAEIVGYGSSGSATGDAAHQRAARGPAYARRVQVKQLAQVSNRTADHNVVIAKKKPAESRDTGGNDQRSARMRRARWSAQVIGLHKNEK